MKIPGLRAIENSKPKTFGVEIPAIISPLTFLKKDHANSLVSMANITLVTPVADFPKVVMLPFPKKNE